MKIQHKKYRNTGLIFELLVKQVASDIVIGRDSPAILILKEHFKATSDLAKEYRLYSTLVNSGNKFDSKKAEMYLDTVLENVQSINRKDVNNAKYNLIKSIKSNYNIDEFFNVKVEGYKALAAMYCLVEAYGTAGFIDPDTIVNNKTTLLEHITVQETSSNDEEAELLKEYASFSKELKLLTYKVLLEKFNKKYSTLLPEQKTILREFIVSSNSQLKLRSMYNEEIVKVKKLLTSEIKKVPDKVTVIKLEEVNRTIKLVESAEKIRPEKLVHLMQYYTLLAELKAL